MNKENFQVPELDEHLVQSQIKQIVEQSVAAKPTFSRQMNTMYSQISMRQIFADRKELSFIFLIGVLLFGWLFFIQQHLESEAVYTGLFLISPVLFLGFSLYSYWTRVEQDTYEVEMACKFNVYQLMAFRMLAFSVLSILVNSFFIALVAQVHPNIHFIRALMISLTSLFIFSNLFLWTLMKRHSLVTTAAMVFGWIFSNLLLHYGMGSLYGELLVQIPIVIYVLVLLGSLYVYGGLLKKYFDLRQMKGAV
ncbi:hypothetical protein [Sporosarcina obsidiansis]|uniref:hypothetical protein n=1 Tax=Sporosarcina obsidiansis TaxID=2660748 RepID=UPI00129B19F2|nr:hypothetical protein [Sporosarcina obsidiansis]